MGRTWKAVERRILRRFFGTERLGPVGEFGPDGVTGNLCIEVKHRKQLPHWLTNAYWVSVEDNTMPVTRLELDTGEAYALTFAVYLSGVLADLDLVDVESDVSYTAVSTQTVRWSALPKWLEKAVKQSRSRPGRLPVVVLHAKHSTDYLTLMPWIDFMFLMEIGGMDERLSSGRDESEADHPGRCEEDSRPKPKLAGRT